MRANRTYALFFIQTLQNILEVLLCAAFGMLLIHPLAQIYIVPAILLTLAIATTWHINNVLFKHESIVLSLLSSVKTFFTTMYDTANAFFFPSHQAKSNPKKEVSKNTPKSSNNVSYTNNDQKYTHTVSTSAFSLKESLSPQVLSNSSDQQLTFENNNSISSATITVPEGKESSVLTKKTTDTLSDENINPNTSHTQINKEKTAPQSSSTITTQSERPKIKRIRPQGSVAPPAMTQTVQATVAVSPKTQLSPRSFDQLYYLMDQFAPFVIDRNETETSDLEKESKHFCKKIEYCKKLMQKKTEDMAETYGRYIDINKKLSGEEIQTAELEKETYDNVQKEIDKFLTSFKDIYKYATSLDEKDGKKAVDCAELLREIVPLLIDEAFLSSREDHGKLIDFDETMVSKLRELQDKLKKMKEQVTTSDMSPLKEPQRKAAEHLAVYACAMYESQDQLWYFGNKASTNKFIKLLQKMYATEKKYNDLFPQEGKELNTRTLTSQLMSVVRSESEIRKLHAMLHLLGKKNITISDIEELSFVSKDGQFLAHTDRNVLSEYAQKKTTSDLESIQKFISTMLCRINSKISLEDPEIKELSKYYGPYYPVTMSLYMAPLIFDGFTDQEKTNWERLANTYKVGEDFPNDKRIYQYLGRLIAKQMYQARKKTTVNITPEEVEKAREQAISVYALFQNYMNHKNSAEIKEEDTTKLFDRTLSSLQIIDPLLALNIYIDFYNSKLHDHNTPNTSTPIASVNHTPSSKAATTISTVDLQQLFTPESSTKQIVASPVRDQVRNSDQQLADIYAALRDKLSYGLLENYSMFKEFIFSPHAINTDYADIFNQIVGIFLCVDSERDLKIAIEQFLNVYPPIPGCLEGLYKYVTTLLAQIIYEALPEENRALARVDQLQQIIALTCTQGNFTCEYIIETLSRLNSCSWEELLPQVLQSALPEENRALTIGNLQQIIALTNTQANFKCEHIIAILSCPNNNSWQKSLTKLISRALLEGNRVLTSDDLQKIIELTDTQANFKCQHIIEILSRPNSDSWGRSLAQLIYNTLPEKNRVTPVNLQQIIALIGTQGNFECEHIIAILSCPNSDSWKGSLAQLIYNTLPEENRALARVDKLQQIIALIGTKDNFECQHITEILSCLNSDSWEEKLKTILDENSYSQELFSPICIILRKKPSDLHAGTALSETPEEDLTAKTSLSL